MITITMKDKEKFKHDKIAEVCAEWWANVIKNPKFDAGSDSPAMLFSQMMACNLVEPVDDLQLHSFKDNLKEIIMVKLVETGGITLDCDYNPCANLTKAAEDANVSLRNFPWKTTMVIHTDMAKVSYGYRATYEKIYDERQ